MVLDLGRLLDLLLHALGGDRLLEQARVLDLHRGDVGQVRQKLQVVDREQSRLLPAVDVDEPDHLAVVPEGRAHERADLLDLDALSRLEALVEQRVGGED